MDVDVTSDAVELVVACADWTTTPLELLTPPTAAVSVIVVVIAER